MSPGKDETRVCGYIRSEFIHWALWRTLMRTEYFLFVHHTTSILAKLSTWCFEHSGNVNCSLLVNPSHTGESWEGILKEFWHSLSFINFLIVNLFMFVCWFMCMYIFGRFTFKILGQALLLRLFFYLEILLFILIFIHKH